MACLNICPSGAVSPDNAREWWNAGAVVVGMGSNLVGNDINFAPGKFVIMFPRIGVVLRSACQIIRDVSRYLFSSQSTLG